MKTLFTIGLFLAALSCYSQSKETYVFTQDMLLKQCTVEGNPFVPEQTVTVQKGWRFDIAAEQGDFWIIYLFQWDDKAKDSAYTYAADGITRRYFLIKKINLEKLAQKVSAPWFVIGTLITPIKIRFGSKDRDANGIRVRSFDFTSDVNLGLTIGTRLLSSYSRNVHLYGIGGIGLTSVAIDSSTTKGFVKSESNASALTPFLGIMIKVDDFQLVFYGGADYIAKQPGDYWAYQGKPWLGIGIGYSIFKGPTAEKN